MRKKKIAMVLTLGPESGGGYQYAMLVAECLKEWTSQYDLIAICTNSGWHKWCKKNHIKYITVNWPEGTRKQLARDLMLPLCSKIYHTYMTRLGRTIRQEKVDLLFITGQLMYVPNLDVKMIAPVHDLMHRYESRFPEVKEDYKHRELLLKCQARYLDYILTDSRLGKKQFIDSYLQGAKKKPHIVSLPYIAPSYVLETKEEYIHVPDKYVFYPAQFWKHKNHINLIKAIEILKSEIDDIHLVLVGSEKNCCEEIKKYISNHGLQDRITILGFVSDGNMVYLYKHAVGMIMPSYFGPTNIPPLEAMALGCPVAVSDKYAMSEQVGEAGLLFNPDSMEEIAECISRLWKNKPLRESLVQKGYRRISVWNRQRFEERLLKIVERCLI